MPKENTFYKIAEENERRGIQAESDKDLAYTLGYFKAILKSNISSEQLIHLYEKGELPSFFRGYMQGAKFNSLY